jgi:hypothetical protein
MRNQETRNQKKKNDFHILTTRHTDGLISELCKFKEMSIKLDQIMQNMVVFETVFEEQLNAKGSRELKSINK